MGPAFSMPRSYEVPDTLITKPGDIHLNGGANTGWQLLKTGMTDGSNNNAIAPVTFQGNVDTSGATDVAITFNAWFANIKNDTIGYRLNGGTWRTFSPPFDTVNSLARTVLIPVELSDVRAGSEYAGDEVGIGRHHHRQPRAHAERTLIEPRMPLPDVRPSRSAWVSLVVALVAACGGGGPQEPQVEAPADARVALRAMALDAPATPPPDTSNRFADDPRAAALGQQLFFDPRFSGALLETDNTGDPQTLGRVGETGKVACAGCHVPGAGFLDNRSARQTVSLAAGWTRRKARSLLDVGQARLLMWDGRHDALYNQVFEALENPVDMNSSRLFAAEQIYKHYRATYESIFGAIPIPLDDKARFPELDGSTTGCSRLLPDDTGAHCAPGHVVTASLVTRQSSTT